MRVVHLCNVALPAEHPDAGKLSLHPGRWVLNLALAQRAHAGIDARLVMQVPGASGDFCTEIEGVPVHFVAAPDRLRSTTLFVPDVLRLRRAVLAQSPDFVHAHGTEDAYALAAQACHKPTIITVQGCFFIINRELPPKLVSRQRIVQFTEWVALQRARHVIVKSAYVRDELRGAFPRLEFHEIPNTVDQRWLELPLDLPRPEYDLAFVGTMVERKGVHDLTAALAVLRDGSPEFFRKIRLHVLGDRPGSVSAYETMQKSALRDLLGERVIFHGTKSAAGVAEVLTRVRLLVAPSLEEMFGNQLIEALLAGADAVVTEGTAMAENVSRIGAGRAVPRRDPAALAEAIRNAAPLVRAATEREQVRGRIVDFMGPEVVAQAHARLYEQIIEENKR